MSTERTTTYRLEQIVSARVEQIFPFGLFVRLEDGTEAYIRRRELTQAGDKDPRRVVQEGDIIEARVIALAGPKRRMEVSVRRAEPDPWDEFLHQFQAKDTVKGTVKTVDSAGVLVQVWPGVDGYLPQREMAPWRIDKPGELLWAGDQVEAVITQISAPNKWMHLSIKRQMTKWVANERRRRDINARLRKRGIVADAEPEEQQEIEETEEPAAIPTIDLGVLGPILVYDDHHDVEQELVSWLQMHGGRPDGVSTPEMGIEQAEESPYGVALVDPDLAQQDGLEFLRDLHAANEDAPILVMSTPEWVAEQSEQLEELGVAYAFTKPLDLDEVQEILARLAHGETVGPFRVTEQSEDEAVSDTFQRLAEEMRVGAPLETRLLAALVEALQITGADSGALFHLDPVSQQVRVLAQTGSRTLEPAALPSLTGSPVKDLILEGQDEFETSMSSDAKRRRYSNLLDAIPFESCMGVPVTVAGRAEHALFLFHIWPGAFQREQLRDAHALAARLSIALESQALEAQLAAAGPFLLGGQLASAYGHDVANKMDLLDLQVRNLRRRCRAFTSVQESAQKNRARESEELMDKLDQLLENTLDLKGTAHAFGELLRADRRERVDVNETMEFASRLLEIATHRERIRVWLNLAPDLPRVAGSAVRLRQVFLNVMLNALQQIALKLENWPYGLGELTITTSFEPEAERPVHMRIADSGPGIHRRLWEQIFALGYSTRPGGVGLGLFIARSLTEAMGGAICVEESLIPVGTVFRIELPTDESTANPRQEEPDD